MLGAQSVRERYVLLYKGDLRAARQYIAHAGGPLAPSPPPFFRGVVVVVVVVIIVVMVLIVIAVISGTIISKRGTRVGAGAGNAVRVVVRDTQDSAVTEYVRLAERAHAAHLVYAGAASEHVRNGRQSCVAGAPGVPGHHDRVRRARCTVGIGGGSLRVRGLALALALALAVRGDVG